VWVGVSGFGLWVSCFMFSRFGFPVFGVAGINDIDFSVADGYVGIGSVHAGNLC